MIFSHNYKVRTDWGDITLLTLTFFFKNEIARSISLNNNLVKVTGTV